MKTKKRKTKKTNRLANAQIWADFLRLLNTCRLFRHNRDLRCLNPFLDRCNTNKLNLDMFILKLLNLNLNLNLNKRVSGP